MAHFCYNSFGMYEGIALICFKINIRGANCSHSVHLFQVPEIMLSNRPWARFVLNFGGIRSIDFPEGGNFTAIESRILFRSLFQ